MSWTYFIRGLNDEEIVRRFWEKELQQTNQTEFRVEKVIKRKADRLYIKWRAMIIHSVAGLTSKIQYNDESIFSLAIYAFWWECKC